MTPPASWSWYLGKIQFLDCLATKSRRHARHKANRKEGHPKKSGTISPLDVTQKHCSFLYLLDAVRLLIWEGVARDASLDVSKALELIYCHDLTAIKFSVSLVSSQQLGYIARSLTEIDGTCGNAPAGGRGGCDWKQESGKLKNEWAVWRH